MTVAIFHHVAWQMRKIDKLSLFVLMGVCGLARAYCVAQKMNKSPKKIYCLITKIISNHSTNSKSETPKVLYDIYSSSNNNLQPATFYTLGNFKIQWLTYFLRFLRRYIKLWRALRRLELPSFFLCSYRMYLIHTLSINQFFIIQFSTKMVSVPSIFKNVFFKFNFEGVFNKKLYRSRLLDMSLLLKTEWLDNAIREFSLV